MHLYAFLTCGIILSEDAGQPQEDVTFTHMLNKKESSSRLYYCHFIIIINFKLLIMCNMQCIVYYIINIIAYIVSLNNKMYFFIYY